MRTFLRLLFDVVLALSELLMQVVFVGTLDLRELGGVRVLLRRQVALVFVHLLLQPALQILQVKRQALTASLYKPTTVQLWLVSQCLWCSRLLTVLNPAAIRNCFCIRDNQGNRF